jgi:hypothetical protein
MSAFPTGEPMAKKKAAKKTAKKKAAKKTAKKLSGNVEPIFPELS